MTNELPINVDVLKIEEAKERLAALPAVDRQHLRQQRLDRLQAELSKRDLGGILLYDPIWAPSMCATLPIAGTC